MYDSTPLAIVGVVLLLILAIWILCYVVISLVHNNSIGNVISTILLLLLYIWLIYAYSGMWQDGDYVTVALVILFILILLNLPLLASCWNQWWYIPERRGRKENREDWQ